MSTYVILFLCQVRYFEIWLVFHYRRGQGHISVKHILHSFFSMSVTCWILWFIPPRTNKLQCSHKCNKGQKEIIFLYIQYSELPAYVPDSHSSWKEGGGESLQMIQKEGRSRSERDLFPSLSGPPAHISRLVCRSHQEGLSNKKIGLNGCQSLAQRLKW